MTNQMSGRGPGSSFTHFSLPQFLAKTLDLWYTIHSSDLDVEGNGTMCQPFASALNGLLSGAPLRERGRFCLEGRWR